MNFYPMNWQPALMLYALKRKIGFLTTAFDFESLNFVSKLRLDYIKIPSGEITNLPYLNISFWPLHKLLLLATCMEL